MNAVLFEELHPDELEKIIKESGIVYLPLGTLEWHGRHLPFGVDSFIAYELCKEVCKKVGGCIIPPLYFGTDREHTIDGKVFHGMDARAKKVLTGSIYFLKQNIFEDMLRSIIYSISEQGFKKLVIVSGHSGTAQQQTLEKLVKEKIGNLNIYIFPGKYWVGGIDHAAKIETQLMLTVKKNLVEHKKLNSPYEGLEGDDPQFAKETDGKAHFEAVVKQIVEEITK